MTRVLMWLLFGAIRLRQAEAQRTLPKEVAMATTVSQICTRFTAKHHGFTGFERGIKELNSAVGMCKEILAYNLQ